MKGKKTGGRQKGSVNKETALIKDILDENVDFSVVVTKLFELTKGIASEKIYDGIPVVYKEKPDAFAAKTLIEMRYGKPKQDIDLGNNLKFTVSIKK